MGHFLLLQAGTPPAELDPIALMLHASLVVKLVLLTLVGMSVACWFIIGSKVMRLRQATAQSAKFLEAFWAKDAGPWKAERLEAIYAQMGPLQGSPLARVFHAGYVELAKLTQGEKSPTGGDLESVERALKRAAGNEMTQLENQLPVLATTGSTGPFIGLFGTVWGIMSSFLAIGAQHGATLDVVAPGIAEALVATAVGLFAAIPAAVGYNYSSARLNRLSARLETFCLEFCDQLRRTPVKAA